MKEIWKEIIGFEGIYEVSNLGRVRRIKTGNVLSTSKCGGCREYSSVCLSKNGKIYSRLVHRLVAEAFIPRPNGLYEVNHLDEDKSNNRVENLEWCNHKYNMNYGSRMDKVRVTRLRNGTYTGLDRKTYERKYYQEHKEEMKEYLKKYYQEHKDDRLEYSKKYREKHKEEIKKYSENHKEELNEKRKKYYQEHKEEKRKYYQEHKEEMKKYREEHKEELREKKRAYYIKHKEEIKEKSKKYYQEHKKK